jgi:hypothetical protein
MASKSQKVVGWGIIIPAIALLLNALGILDVPDQLRKAQGLAVAVGEWMTQEIGRWICLVAVLAVLTWWRMSWQAIVLAWKTRNHDRQIDQFGGPFGQNSKTNSGNWRLDNLEGKPIEKADAEQMIQTMWLPKGVIFQLQSKDGFFASHELDEPHSLPCTLIFKGKFDRFQGVDGPLDSGFKGCEIVVSLGLSHRTDGNFFLLKYLITPGGAEHSWFPLPNSFQNHERHKMVPMAVPKYCDADGFDVVVFDVPGDMTAAPGYKFDRLTAVGFRGFELQHFSIVRCHRDRSPASWWRFLRRLWRTPQGR